MMIIIAWTTAGQRPTNLEDRRVDLGEPVKWTPTTEPHAVTWLLDGTDTDVDKAVAHAESMGHPWSVYTMPTRVLQPLVVAKRVILNDGALRTVTRW